jgi:streptogramin lyase
VSQMLPAAPSRTTFAIRRPAIALAALMLGVLALLLTSSAALAAPLGQITEFSTGLSAGARPEGIVAGGDGNLWFLDRNEATPSIGRITPSGVITEFGVSAGLNVGSHPRTMVLGPDGNLWFTDEKNGPSSGPSAIGRVTPEGAITEFSTGLNAAAEPGDIVVGPDGNLWFTDDNHFGGAPAMGRITPATGTITEFSAGLGAGEGARYPFHLISRPDGNVWFTAYKEGAGAIGQITPTGTITLFAAGLHAGSQPEDLGAGPDGNLWFTDESFLPSVGLITPGGAITEFKTGLNPQSQPEGGIVAGVDGNLWLGDDGNDPGSPPAIGRVTTGGTITEFRTGLGANASPREIIAAPDGNLWFADVSSSAPAIGRATTAGKIHEFGLGTAEEARIPSNIVAGPDGNLWFGETYAGAIGRIGTEGELPGAEESPPPPPLPAAVIPIAAPPLLSLPGPKPLKCKKGFKKKTVKGKAKCVKLKSGKKRKKHGHS